MGMLRDQENLRFDNYNTKARAKLMSVRLGKLEMRQKKGPVLSTCNCLATRWQLECDWVVRVFDKRCSQLLSECLMNFQGHNPTTIAGMRKILPDITAKSLIEVDGSQERISPAAEVVGQGNSEDICSKFLAGTVNQLSVVCWGRSLEK